MAETAIAAVLSKFGELAASEAKILLEVGDNMTLLRDRLEWLQAFIRDADRKRRAGTDQLTRVWVRQTRDVAFEAEDTLDEFIYQVDLKSQGYRCWKKVWRKYLTGFCTQILSRHALSARIKSINTRLAKISENQKEYNIGHTPLAPVTSSTTAISAWPDDAVGFDGDVMKLRQLLLREDHQRQMFISILGESGVGKTTLVMMILQKVASMFDVVFGLGVPADSTVDFVLERIYEFGLLAGKRYLVVLFGIPSKTMLSCVRASLPDENNGSRVLLVLDTEYEEVAWHANSMNNQEGFNGIHMLSRLDEKGSGQLFRSRAFRREIVCNDGSKEDSMMMTNNRDDRYHKIVNDITGGYPLAIVVLAGLLRFKERPGQWEAVLQQLRPGPRMEEALLVQGGDGEGIKQITEEVVQSTSHANLVSARTTAIERVFWASFEDLPNDLKSCFLYFAAFPKNTSWTADETVLAWIAEGFIKPQKGKTMEELGRSYLKELVLRCLVQINTMNAAGGIENVRVHPRLLGFLQSEAREAGFMEVHDMHHVFVPPSVRRLSFMSLGGRYIPFTNKFPKLRSFICWVDKEQQHQSNDSQDTNSKKHGHDLKFLCGSKFLRVIKVHGLMIEKLPNKIGEMIHLRHLGVQCKDLKELPSSIKRLLNLQTLNIQNTQVEMIDPGFWKIRTLRHVLAEKLTLPETIEEELGELQTLSGVKPAQGGEWKGQKCALHKMPNLRTLKLHGIAHEKHGPALKSALTKMHLLADLSLQGDVIPSSVFTAPSLRFLQTVELDGSVEWPEDGWDGSKVRPNLVYYNLRNTNEVPQHIREEFDKIIPINTQEVQEILVED
ncbi:putative disease resistance protein At1g50180 [Miscanthus floridulus]|uniref:putative disease resistance protein At1g50180 n=1 Tax=Miscanthus floridulus TaxID=154761 RepID=UPI0034584ACD